MDIEFFEKPGCIANRRQKTLLRELGHNVIARNLLTEPWSRETLLQFVNGRPVAEWFNRSAPAVKSGEIVPGAYQAEDALALLIADPILIHRPLMRTALGACMGFDEGSAMARIGITVIQEAELTDTCPRTDDNACNIIEEQEP